MVNIFLYLLSEALKHFAYVLRLLLFLFNQPFFWNFQ